MPWNMVASGVWHHWCQLWPLPRLLCFNIYMKKRIKMWICVFCCYEVLSLQCLWSWTYAVHCSNWYLQVAIYNYNAVRLTWQAREINVFITQRTWWFSTIDKRFGSSIATAFYLHTKNLIKCDFCWHMSETWMNECVQDMMMMMMMMIMI